MHQPAVIQMVVHKRLFVPFHHKMYYAIEET
jgi:hypothetical protein